MALSRDAAFTLAKPRCETKRARVLDPGFLNRVAPLPSPVAGIHPNERSQCRAASSLGSN